MEPRPKQRISIILFLTQEPICHSLQHLSEKHVIETEVKDHCGVWHPGASITFTLSPTCYQDNPSLAKVDIVTPIGDTYSDGVHKIKSNVNYTLTNSGLTDFSENYSWSVDGGSDIQFSGNTVSVSADIGSYIVSATPKAGREICPVPTPIKIAGSR
jgi:hypothetical protein